MVGRRILGPSDIERLLKRMALEIAEKHYDRPLSLIVPASPRGKPIAERLLAYLQAEGLSILLSPSSPSEVTSVLLVDDVLYTGRTLLNEIIRTHTQYPEAFLEALVLIDRGHRHYPVGADYVGLRLATTLQEYVRMRISPEGWEVWLE